jgi:hypothetical protein
VSIVLAWSGDALNPAGIEYIVMEKATGYQLREVWGEMNQLQKYKEYRSGWCSGVIQNLVMLESQLASLKFPGYGNLYIRQSVRHIGRVIPIDGFYCIGPVYNASWFPQFDNKNDAGPCLFLSSMWLIRC